MPRKKHFFFILANLLLFLAMDWGSTFAISQGLPGGGGEPPARVEKVRIGPHPEFTRILIDLDRPTGYRVEANFLLKKITLTLEGARLGPQVRSRTMRDRNLKKISIRPLRRSLEITFHLRQSNTRFFHFLDPGGSRIVVDFKGETKPILRTRVGKKPGESPQNGLFSQQKEKGKPGRKARITGMTPQKIRQVNRKNYEEKLNNGWEAYQKALQTYQEKDYPEAVQLFDQFLADYPKSKYRAHILYLEAEAKFQIAYREPNPIYEDALLAYKYALRQYPDSRFSSHAVDKIAFIYNEMGYILEAKTIYEEALKKDPKSQYTPTRKTSLAGMLLKDGKYAEAYGAFQKLLENAPKNIEARDAIFEIARHFYEAKDFQRSIEIYEDGARRWPSELNDHPDIHFNMGDIYYREKKYTLARKFFFNLLNLAPDFPKSHQALNMIGDSYLLEGNYLNALAVFDESAKKQSGGPEAQYAQIRMADIGIINPRLKVRDIIYNSTPYFQPYKTYNQIFKEAEDMEILAEVTLSRGIAFMKEQNYLKAIDMLKKLLPLGKESRFYNPSRNYIKQSLVFLVDQYAKQGGVLPILYSYNDFISLSLGNVSNIKTLFQIGEAYQAIGMFPEALKFYEQVKKRDTKGLFKDRIFLNLGNIHLEEKNYREAELVARSFLKNYPRSKEALAARKLLAAAYTGQSRHKKALEVYGKLLSQNRELASEIHYRMGETYNGLNDLPSAIGEYQKAIAAYKRTTRIVPDYLGKAYYQLGTALYQDGEYTQAVKALESAVQLFPKHHLKDWADFLLAQSYEKLHKKNQVTSKLNALIQSKETDPLLKEAAASKLKMLNWEKEFKERL